MQVCLEACAGLSLTNEDEVFKKWFIRFLDLRGRWLNSTSSRSTLDAWMANTGTAEYPFNIDDYEVPTGGFRSFNPFFLRNVKPQLRPLCAQAGDPNAVVAFCDGGVFYLTRGELIGNAYRLPGKSQDSFELLDGDGFTWSTSDLERSPLGLSISIRKLNKVCRTPHGLRWP